MKYSQGSLRTALSFNYSNVGVLNAEEVRVDIYMASTIPSGTGISGTGTSLSGSGSKVHVLPIGPTPAVFKAARRSKAAIPKTLKRLVWNTYIGDAVGKSKCYCCKSAEIHQIEFHCGHVKSESNGGLTVLANLRPICAQCNLSMGARNMDDFMKEYGFGETDT